MTTLAACRVGTTYALASDRKLNSNDDAFSAVPKSRPVAPWLALAGTGPSAIYGWLRSLSVDEAPTDAASAIVVLDRIADDFRAFAKERGIEGSAFLGTTPWGIVMLHSEGSASLYVDTEYAIGSGAAYALGAMHGAASGPLAAPAAEEHARRAVWAASRYDEYTGGTIDVLTIEAAP